MKKILIASTFTLLVFLLLVFPIGTSGEQPVVFAILFYSPTCPHCHIVITEDLPPILEKYGDQVFILGINTYSEKGSELFDATIKYFNIPNELAGVPLLVIGEDILIGSLDIPEQLPHLVEKGITSGGVAWPAIPGLSDLLEEENISSTNQDEIESTEEQETHQTEQGKETAEAAMIQDQTNIAPDSPVEVRSGTTGDSLKIDLQTSIYERFSQDITGNSLSTLVLVGMVLSVLFGGIKTFRRPRGSKRWPIWMFPILIFIGMIVSGYLVFVEITQSEAVCGPVGDCNTVQQSPYAMLFGIIPIGLLGVLVYFILGILWSVAFFGEGNWRSYGLIALWFLTLFGTLFSIYLTYLEPFVIGATCAWCLSSAVVMTLLFWNATLDLRQSGGFPGFSLLKSESDIFYQVD